MRLRTIEPVLRRALRGPCRLPAGARVLVAASGGADSTALLLGLARLSDELGIEVMAAHLHHGLRGEDADADMEFVRSLCARIGVPFHGARWNTRERMRRRALSGQAGLRRLRSEFLRGVARKRRAAAIATGHTADDQLETLLLRLGRGAGLRGMGGITPRRGPWIRPLLLASRDQIEADLRKAGEFWREDASNTDLGYARNRVRHQAIPALASALGRMRGPLARRVAATLEEVQEAERIVTGRAASLVSALRTGDDISLDCARLRAAPPLLRKSALRLAWARLGAGEGLTEAHLQSLLCLLSSDRGGVALPGGHAAIQHRGQMSIGPRLAGIEPRPTVTLAVPGKKSWKGHEFRTRLVPGSTARASLTRRSQSDEFFATEGLEGALQLRPGRTDEWFTPFGDRKPRRLGQFLRKQRVPLAGRIHPMVLADAQGILWVVGVRRAARALLTPETREALWIHTRLR